MRFAAIFLLLAMGTRACAGGLVGAAAAASDQARLQGYWLLYALLPGQKLQPNADDGGLLQISGNQVRAVERGKKSNDPPEEMSFTIDPRQNPKAIDIHRT
jgi:uncharacterized protein (TIGR03067 family)